MKTNKQTNKLSGWPVLQQVQQLRPAGDAKTQTEPTAAAATAVPLQHVQSQPPLLLLECERAAVWQEEESGPQRVQEYRCPVRAGGCGRIGGKR